MTGEISVGLAIFRTYTNQVKTEIYFRTNKVKEYFSVFVTTLNTSTLPQDHLMHGPKII